MNAPFVLPNRTELAGERIPEHGKRDIAFEKLESQPFYLHYRFDDAGWVREIAYSSKRESADLRMLLSFTCDVVSRLLQVGWTLDQVAAIGTDKYMAEILVRAAVAQQIEQQRLAKQGEAHA